MARIKPEPNIEKAPDPMGPVGGVRVQKREVKAPALREKICATCGKPFQLEPGQKFFDCPACYRRKQLPQKPVRKSGARALVQIHCAQCGAEEYLEFVPQDPGTALCSACFAARKREPSGRPPHNVHR